MALVLSGDSGAFAPLVERHKRGIVNFIHASIRSVEDANDLAQDTFVRAYAHLRSYNPGLAKFSTWLYQIARNVVRTHLGKERRRPQSQELFEDESLEQRVADESRDAAPERSMIARDEDAEVRAALAAIPEKMRSALVLRYFRHMEYQEIAAAMRESLGNVKTLIHRGKIQLARALADAPAQQAARSDIGRLTTTATRGRQPNAAESSGEGRHEVLCL